MVRPDRIEIESGKIKEMNRDLSRTPWKRRSFVLLHRSLIFNKEGYLTRKSMLSEYLDRGSSSIERRFGVKQYDGRRTDVQRKHSSTVSSNENCEQSRVIEKLYYTGSANRK
ncbi:hypothetical protein KPH14_011117 [Odynerus spinipes]|uniref:Uncharacterized protein n=1 Tax=Odynerus spinipes TaxID=1348599 RepID=A0AAD9RFU1_9HYME|nr:hypothetical protein KPH14_011117 [Odynerus spinipes]